MEQNKEITEESHDSDAAEDEAIENALKQMDLIIKSRCVQPPTGSNVTIREIKKDD